MERQEQDGMGWWPLAGWRMNTELVFWGLAGSVAAASTPLLPELVPAGLCLLWGQVELGSPGPTMVLMC